MGRVSAATQHDLSSGTQFSVKSILIATFVVAAAIAIACFSMRVVAWVYYATAIGLLMRTAIRHAHWRIEIAAAWLCPSMPFLWILSQEQTGNILQNLWWMFAGLPGLVPMLIVGRQLELQRDDGNFLAVAFTATEILIGLWLIRLGPKRTIAFLVWGIALSLFSSIVLNAMVRA